MAAASSKTPRLPLATLADLLAIAEDARWHEVLDGVLIEKAVPSAEHSLSQANLIRGLAGFHGKSGGPPRPGGWWILTEPSIELAPHQVVQPDLAAWRRDRMPQRPRGYPVYLRPDWVCEVMMDSNARRRDGVQKRRIFADHAVPHYWLVDVERRTLTVLRLEKGGYREILEANHSETVRAQPFDDLVLSIAEILGEE